MEFIKLNDKETEEYRQWAIDNYTPFTPINGIWHPEIQEQCVAINIANSTFYTDDGCIEV